MNKNKQSPPLLLVIALLAANISSLQTAHANEELLWPNGAPHQVANNEIDKPNIKVYLPDPKKLTGTAVIVCPGGAYTHIESSYEGDDIAQWLNSIGVAAFVLKYRLPPRYRKRIPLNDALRAIRYVRFNKDRYNLKANQIGILGFSAGGHLASTALTHYKEAEINSSDPIDKVSSRPDFGILGYSITTFLPPYTWQPAVEHLLGKNASLKERKEFSNELHVTPDTPPTFLFHSIRDVAVPEQDSVLFFLALRKNHVPAELHVYEQGAHGTGLANGIGRAPDLPLFRTWTVLAQNWLKGRHLLDRYYSSKK